MLLRIHRASKVPGGGSSSRKFCVAATIQEHATSASTTSKSGVNGTVDWNETINLATIDDDHASSMTVRFQLMRRSSRVVGEAFAEFSVAPSSSSNERWLLLHETATTKRDAIMSGNPRAPCYLCVSLVSADGDKIPPPLPPPPYPRHVLMINRGTRGDLQPMVTLALGFAEQLNWRVTIIAEQRFGAWVEAKVCAVTRGKVCFMPSGGDTESRRLQASTTPIDYLICGFTVVAAGMIVSEKFGLPMIPLIMQPRCIPSKHHRAIEPIPRRVLGRFDPFKPLERAFTTHRAVSFLKTFTEAPIAHLTRREFGLKPGARPWSLLRKLNTPIVIPMPSTAFQKPRDWEGRRIHTTDFLMLRTEHDKATSAEALTPELDQFLAINREGNVKVVLMTFSSMPVKTRQALRCACRMVEESTVPCALLFVGKRWKRIPKALETRCDALKAQHKLLELAGADFGLLFPRVDAFVVHGGLGTTAEALKCGKPVAVSGVLHLDQRFWGRLCEKAGIGPPPVFIDAFQRRSQCVRFVEQALGDDSTYARNAKRLAQEGAWGTNDAAKSLAVNVETFRRLFEDEGVAPIRASASARGRASACVAPVGEG